MQFSQITHARKAIKDLTTKKKKKSDIVINIYAGNEYKLAIFH